MQKKKNHQILNQFLYGLQLIVFTFKKPGFVDFKLVNWKFWLVAGFYKIGSQAYTLWKNASNVMTMFIAMCGTYSLLFMNNNI